MPSDHPDDPTGDTPEDDDVLPTVQGGLWTVDPQTRDALQAQAIDAALRAGDLLRVVVTLEEHLDRTPDDLEALRLVAATETARRDPLTARAAWYGVIAAGGDTADAWLQLALTSYDAADLAGARHAAEQAAARDPRCGEAWYMLALLASHDGDDDTAWSLYRRAFVLHPLACPLPLPLPRPRDVLREAFRRAPRAVRTAWRTLPVSFERHPSEDDLHGTVPPLSPRTLVLADGAAEGEATPRGLRVFVENLRHHEDEDAAADALSLGLLDEFEAWADGRPASPDAPSP